MESPHSSRLLLSSLLAGEAEVVGELEKRFASQGWTLVENDVPSLRDAVKGVDKIEKWFQNDPTSYAEPFNAKMQWRLDNNLMMTDMTFGYGLSMTRRKESFRMCTGNEFDGRYVPPEFRTELEDLSVEIDAVLAKILHLTSPKFFGCDASTFCRDNDVPFDFWHTAAAAKKEKNTSKEQPRAEEEKGERKGKRGILSLFRRKNTQMQASGGSGVATTFGVLDVAYYRNQGAPPHQAAGLNCASHWDPGVYSLSVYSSQPGLEMQAADGRSWVPVNPDGDTLVLWTGNVASQASKKRLKPGIHRVVAPDSFPAPPRMAVWTEIATWDQLIPPVPGLGYSAKHASWSNEGRDHIVVPNLFLPDSANAEPLKMKVEQGNVMRALRAVEDVYGLPMVKVNIGVEPDPNTGLVEPWGPNLSMPGERLYTKEPKK